MGSGGCLLLLHAQLQLSVYLQDLTFPMRITVCAVKGS